MRGLRGTLASETADWVTFETIMATTICAIFEDSSAGECMLPQGLPSAVRWHTFRRLCEVLLAATKRLLCPEWVILYQSRPFQFCISEWLTLLNVCPLTRGVVVFGPWCESEPRTGSPLPGTWRVSWSQWQTYGHRILRAMAAPRSFYNTLPLTVAPEELLLAQWDAAMSAARTLAAYRWHIMVIGRDLKELTWLGKLLEGLGFGISVHCSINGRDRWNQADLVVYVCSWALEEEGNLLRNLLQQAQDALSRGCPWIVVAGCYDPTATHRLKNLGVKAVLPKPIFLWDLLETIQTVLVRTEVHGIR